MICEETEMAMDASKESRSASDLLTSHAERMTRDLLVLRDKIREGYNDMRCGRLIRYRGDLRESINAARESDWF